MQTLVTMLVDSMNVDEYPLVVPIMTLSNKSCTQSMNRTYQNKRQYWDSYVMLQKRMVSLLMLSRAKRDYHENDGRFVDKRLNMNVKVDADEAREKNERLMNIVKTKLALKN